MVDETPLEHLVRDGLFLAASRTYAEQYVEPFIRAKYELIEPASGDHDALGKDGTRFEIKACKVLKSSQNRKGSRTLLERITYENKNLPTNRLVPFSDAYEVNYDANVQNVKRDHFDTLIYVLLFADCAKVFWANTSDIATGIFVNWSDKHGRYDAPGKSGQFPVTRTTIRWHVEHNLRDTVSYQEMADVFQRLSDSK